jgi:hypothetical protein
VGIRVLAVAASTAGPVEFVVEWPTEAIPVTRHAVDAGVFLEASAKSEILWPEAGASAGARSASVTLRSYGPTESLEEPEPEEPNGNIRWGTSAHRGTSGLLHLR